MNEKEIIKKLLDLENEIKDIKSENNDLKIAANQFASAIRASRFDIDSNTSAILGSHGGSGIIVNHGSAGELEIIGADVFPWDKLQFGWSYTLTDDTTEAGKIRILTGSVVKATATPVVVAEADVTIATSDTYVGLQIQRDMTNASIITSSSEIVTDDNYVRFWFYIFKTDGIALPQKYNLGQIMNVDITAYGD